MSMCIHLPLPFEVSSEPRPGRRVAAVAKVFSALQNLPSCGTKHQGGVMGPSSDPSHTGRSEREKALAGRPGKC